MSTPTAPSTGTGLAAGTDAPAGTGTAPTGRQFELTSGGRLRAVVTELGAMLRLLEVDGVSLIEGFDESVYPQFCAGWMLVPWPNRVRDGRWSYDGVERQLPLTEPERGNALHGFLFGLVHTVVSQSDSSITLRALIEPSEAYPFALTVDTTFTLSDTGAPAGAAQIAGPAAPAGPATPAAPVLTITHALTNTGDRDAPTAIGAHPYFRIGDVPTEQLTVTVDAATRVTVDARLNPTGTAPVAGTPYDLRRGTVVGGSDLDTAYLDLTPAADGRYRHSIAAPDGRRIELWGDENYSQAQVFTTPIFSTAAGPGWAVTVEPTTAPPDALNTGENLRWIAPGDSWTSSWGIDFAAATAAGPTAAGPTAAGPTAAAGPTTAAPAPAVTPTTTPEATR
ncbi:aldose 1-epimerase family protein [Subtercola endophyticus]|uniref:aldose 1-epimerase family protein n=1 Tax=Subtercola endophyticus TaxID=2895559 RepID=UPI00272B535F|nr:aldose 1-epimerase family protein [Subtercola endophyticus]